MRNRNRNFQPTGWQLDPNSITTGRVQYWSRGVMRRFVTQAQARQMVADGYAYVISEQAVSAMAGGVANN